MLSFIGIHLLRSVLLEYYLVLYLIYISVDASFRNDTPRTFINFI